MNTVLKLMTAAAVLAGGHGIASAADLAGGYVPAPVPVPVAVASGWYLRGDIGASIHRGGNWHESEIDNQDGTDAFNGWRSTQSGTSANLALGVGYQFNDWLRADLTGEYRFSSSLRGVQEQISTGPAYFTGTDTASLTSWLFLANMYATLTDFNGLKPYVGAGVGFSFNQMSDAKQVSGGAALGSYGLYEDGSKWNFAGALYAGLDYDITRQLSLDVGYRWLWLGDATTGSKTCYDAGGPTACTASGEKWWLKGLNSHDVRIGLRYKFYDEVAYHPPVVAKY